MNQPYFHFYPTGNHVACNLYWSLGIPCGICGREEYDGLEVSRVTSVTYQSTMKQEEGL